MKNLHRELSGAAKPVPRFQVFGSVAGPTVTNSNKFFREDLKLYQYFLSMMPFRIVLGQKFLGKLNIVGI
jgi:hypothetical protein